LAQSAVSQQISRLERALGTPLLTRTSRRVVLTPAGELVRAEAAGLLAQIDGMTRRALAAAAGEQGTVAVGAQGAALIWPVPILLARAASRLPNLQIVVKHTVTEEQIAWLQAGELDLGLVRDAEPREGIVLEDIRRDPVMAVLPRRHRLARRRSLRLHDLAREPFILWGRRGAPRFHDTVIAACRHAGFDPDIRYAVRGIDARLSYVAAGLGVALEPAPYAALCPDGVAFRPVQQPFHATLQLARSVRPPLRAAARVMDIVRDLAREHAAQRPPA
jgi:DNA-binding transcriptional LysR family regulator